jgi:2-C-methyl-D-erythritol 4-phosphate cytidylyltransferase
MNIAVILAAGTGTRFLGENRNVPKQFFEIYRKEVIAYSLETFSSNPNIDEIVVVTNLEYIKKVEEIIKKYDIKKIKGVVAGGVTRQASVYSALHYLRTFYTTVNNNIIIHDAARLLVTNEDINKVIEGLNCHDAVSTAVPLVDTVVESLDGETMGKNIDRSKIYRLQTPQGFKFDTLVKAHKIAQGLGDNEFTDDCSLMRLINEPVYLVKGKTTNLKLTTGDDLVIIQGILDMKGIK